jgi:nucleotide-binding universal stress UspA family protein
MKILLATDGSQPAASAMRTAARLLQEKLRKEDLQAELVCVVPDYVPPASAETKGPHKVSQRVKQYREQLALEARKMLIHAQAALVTEGINAITHVATGSPARQPSGYETRSARQCLNQSRTRRAVFGLHRTF